jgi:hypothetical protein
MASGHMSRTRRPNTWLLRPRLRRCKKVLANAEPSTHGTSGGLRRRTNSVNCLFALLRRHVAAESICATR